MKPWELLDTSLLISRRPWLSVYRETVRLPSGRVLDDFYRVVLPDFAVVVAFTVEKQLVMVRGYKHGLKRVCLSAPAGLVEPGESPLQTAQRELMEETGYRAPIWQSLGRFVADGNRQCGTAHLFLARDAIRVAPGNQGDETEDLQVELIDPRLFVQHVSGDDVGLLSTVGAVGLAMMAALDGEAKGL
jgi:ADP-ribose pyrophosphatase